MCGVINCKIMKNKIILIFDENCEVSGFQRAYVFCNELDAENFFMSYDAFKEIRIRPNE